MYIQVHVFVFQIPSVMSYAKGLCVDMYCFCFLDMSVNPYNPYFFARDEHQSQDNQYNQAKPSKYFHLPTGLVVVSKFNASSW